MSFPIHVDADLTIQQPSPPPLETIARTLRDRNSPELSPPHTTAAAKSVPVRADDKENRHNQSEQPRERAVEKRKVTVATVGETAAKKPRADHEPAPRSPMTEALWCDEVLPPEYAFGSGFAPTVSESSFSSLHHEYRDLLSRSVVMTHQAIHDSVWMANAANTIRALQTSHAIIAEEKRELEHENEALKERLRQLQSPGPLTIRVPDDRNEGQITHLATSSDIDSNAIPMSVYFAHIDRINENNRLTAERHQKQIQDLHDLFSRQLAEKEAQLEQGTVQSSAIIRSLQERLRALEAPLGEHGPQVASQTLSEASTQPLSQNDEL